MIEHSKNEDQQIKKLNALLKISNIINEKEPPSVLIKKISEVVAGFLDADRVSFFFHDERTDELYTHFAWGLTKGEISVPKDLGIVGMVFSSNSIVRTNAPYDHPHFYFHSDLETGYKTENLIALPVVHKNKTIGAFQALNKKTGNEFTEEDEAFLTELLEQISALLNVLKRRDVDEYQTHMLRDAVSGIIKWADEFRRSHKIGT